MLYFYTIILKLKIFIKSASIIIFILFILSCKTSPNQNSNLQDNKENKSISINNEEKIEINSEYKKVIINNSIKQYNEFLQKFPNSEYVNEIKNKRKKLFLDKENLISDNININDIIKKNPCYIPLYKNIDYIRNTNISFEKLFNSKLDSLNPYRNRYLVADLNTINDNDISKGIYEQYIDITQGWEFKDLLLFAKKYQIDNDSLLLITEQDMRSLVNKLDKHLIIQLKMYKNYYEQVDKYRKKEIKKQYSTYKGYKYTGQNLCFCEISKDTILLIAKHITSGRGKSRTSLGLDSTTLKTKYRYFTSLPTGKNRKYYAAHYRITIKNWETKRKYLEIDELRDSITGGGNARVTFFDNQFELPNFLLMEPDELYPNAMRRNGIHEASLRNMSRCLLGTPQSLGCLRTTDYGSKFSRWWTPKYANLFIYYEDDRYTDQEIDHQKNEIVKLPFKNNKEGNIFREWVNIHYPDYAKSIDLERKGSCNNCFIQIAWERLHKEYLLTTNGKKLNLKK